MTVAHGIDRTGLTSGTGATLRGVEGPASSTDNAAVRFNLTTGVLVQDSLFILDDSGHVSSFGGNIKFPATQVASADANTLDDYEEGTWTPILLNWTVSGAVTKTGTYTKIGNSIGLRANISHATSQSGTLGTSVLHGFPFVLVNQTGGSQVDNSSTGAYRCILVHSDNGGQFFNDTFSLTTQILTVSSLYWI